MQTTQQQPKPHKLRIERTLIQTAKKVAKGEVEMACGKVYHIDHRSDQQRRADETIYRAVVRLLEAGNAQKKGQLITLTPQGQQWLGNQPKP